MNRLVHCLGVLALLARPLAGQTAPDTVLHKEVLGDGIYLFRAPTELDVWTSSNTVVIVNDEDVTVFDANTRPSTTRKVIAEIRKITNKPVRILINSHFHMDHWSGNDEYVKAFPGVQIVATTETRDYMKRSQPLFEDAFTSVMRGAQTRLETATRTGKEPDGSPLRPEYQRALQGNVDELARWVAEMRSVRRVLPTIAFRDSLILWSGRREFRLVSATGDALGSTVLYLPAERLLVTGDVLVSPEDGHGPPPWGAGAYGLSAWLQTLRRLDALDVAVIVPGQGPAMHDKTYLDLTARLYASVIGQVQAALERGAGSLADVQASVQVDSIGAMYTPGKAPSEAFHRWVRGMARQAMKQSLDAQLDD